MIGIVSTQFAVLFALNVPHINIGGVGKLAKMEQARIIFF